MSQTATAYARQAFKDNDAEIIVRLHTSSEINVSEEERVSKDYE